MKVHISELIDLSSFHAMMQSFYQATGIPYGLIDVDDNILSGAGWQDICLNFHRKCQQTLCRCHDSDHYIADHLYSLPFVGYRCGNGMMDYATPVIIDGEHVATMFVGQLFHEPPDMAYFQAQARRYGFDEAAYLAALAKVPVVPRDKVEAAIGFFAKLAEMLAAAGMDRLRELRARREVAALNVALTERVEARTRELAEANAALTAEMRALWRERNFSKAVVESLPGIFYLIDSAGRLALWNKNFEATLGYAAEELAHLPAVALFRDGDAELIAERIGRVFADGRADAQACIVTKDGRGIPYYFTGLRVEMPDGQYVVGVGLDVTERLAAERALEEKAAELARSNADLEQFAYVASHDLREPLRMINSYVSLLERRYGDRLDQDAHDFIAYAKEGATRIDRLVLDLLKYSRVGRTPMPTEPVDSGQAVRQAVENLQLAIRDADAEVAVAEPLPPVLADFDEFSRLFQNLIGNAIKYRRPDQRPAVHVDCQVRPDDLLFRIRDNGIGIPDEYRERIFMIFQRLHGHQQYEGTGIGLAICKKIVERYSGRIWVESAPEGGSTFCFTLPAIKGV